MSSTTLVLAVLALLASAASATPTGHSRGCVLGAAGHEVCKWLHSERSLGVGFAPLSRQSNDDSKVSYCNAAVDITNEIRARHNVNGKVVAGTQSMLDNAVKHCQDMATGLGLKHQDLGEAGKQVGCDVFINRENIASFSGNENDPAVQCMKMWEESDGHLKNILEADDGDYVSVGVYKNGDNWWCTQTFGKPGGGTCPMIGQSSGGRKPPTEVPNGEPKTTPTPIKPDGGIGDGDSQSPTTEAPVATFVDETTEEPKTTIVADGDSTEPNWPGNDDMGPSNTGPSISTHDPTVTFRDKTMDEPKTTVVAYGDSSESHLPHGSPEDDPYASIWRRFYATPQGAGEPVAKESSDGDDEAVSDTHGVYDHMDGMTADGRKVDSGEEPCRDDKGVKNSITHEGEANLYL
jgi:hypothetical protein